MTWLLLALIAYGLMGSCVYWALRPRHDSERLSPRFWAG